MFLKFRYRLGYETLCVEVVDSISWRRFTRIGMDGRVPHPTTLMKITTRCGSEVIEQLNEALLAKAHEGKLLRVGKVRADTTVVSANVQRPTDSGLLAAAIGAMSRQVARIQAAGAAARTRWRDRTRAAGRRARQINSRLRLRQAETRDQPRRPCAGSPANWPTWPPGPPTTPRRCCATPVAPWPASAGGGPGNYAARSTNWRPRCG
jgi:IS5 family transposase